LEAISRVSAAINEPPSFKLECERFDYVSIYQYSHDAFYYEGAGGYTEWNILETKKPLYIIMYDPDLGFIRRLEVYKALNPESHTKVYFMMYDNSVEESQYLATVRREKEAFEKLILQKSSLVIPVDADGRVLVEVQDDVLERNFRNAGGQQISRSMQVLVDIREFRSSLPSLIHSFSMKVVPCHLEVGDYILSPNMCVERKSISDLSQSLKSGRLFTQCESMLSHYPKSILLIEFEATRNFRLIPSQFKEDLNKLHDTDICTRLVLLLIHFPKLRLIWTDGAQATSEIFKDLKEDDTEPVMEDAIKIGGSETINLSYNTIPSNILQSLPGISFQNYKHVMDNVNSLKELSAYSMEQMQQLIGIENGRILFTFFHFNHTIC
jgi:DNA excision repair protein ERCC-4